MTATDALAAETAAAENPRDRPARDEAQSWLADLLADGPMTTADIHEAADAAGLAWRTIQRARTALAAQAIRGEGRNAWLWKLPYE